ncbi:MAG: hypothetical protein WD904_00965 [Dehalococcoidia bacterium]
MGRAPISTPGTDERRRAASSSRHRLPGLSASGSATGIQRQARAFRFAPDSSGGFVLTGEALAAVSSTAAEWLSGQCTTCYYDSFQTWP